MKRFSALLLLLLPGAALAGCDDGKPAADAGKDIAAYAARRAGCNHWGGEDATDAARRAEIDRAATALKCAQIDQDEAVLLRRYRDRPQLLQQIRAARDALL